MTHSTCERDVPCTRIDGKRLSCSGLVTDLAAKEEIAVHGVQGSATQGIAQDHIVIKGLSTRGGDAPALDDHAAWLVGGHASRVNNAHESGDARTVDAQRCDRRCDHAGMTHSTCERDVPCTRIDGERLSCSGLIVDLATKEDIAVRSVQGSAAQGIAQDHIVIKGLSPRGGDAPALDDHAAWLIGDQAFQGLTIATHLRCQGSDACAVEHQVMRPIDQAT